MLNYLCELFGVTHDINVYIFRYQKTNAALQNFGDYASKKIGAIRYFDFC